MTAAAKSVGRVVRLNAFEVMLRMVMVMVMVRYSAPPVGSSEKS